MNSGAFAPACCVRNTLKVLFLPPDEIERILFETK